MIWARRRWRELIKPPFNSTRYGQTNSISKSEDDIVATQYSGEDVLLHTNGAIRRGDTVIEYKGIVIGRSAGSRF